MKYPIYIVSKGRWSNPLTANCFEREGVDYLIAVEPQEVEQYTQVLGAHRILQLPFSNLGMGSMSARNYVWEHARAAGHKRHWVFDDNIQLFRRIHKGKRIPCDPKLAIRLHEEFVDRYTNVAVSGFNYTMFTYTDINKPFRVNTHVYSAMLILNDIPHRWRLKYNEDVDLCLQVLTAGWCTVQWNAFCVDKVSTLAGMKGGNQAELYNNNDPRKFWIKSQALKQVWSEYVIVKYKYSRWHHDVQWHKHFKHRLKRRQDIDWNEIADRKVNIELKQVKEIKHGSIKAFFEQEAVDSSKN